MQNNLTKTLDLKKKKVLFIIGRIWPNLKNLAKQSAA